MFDIVAADDEKPLARSDHQGLHDGKTLVRRGLRVTPGTPKRRASKAGAADQGQHQKQRAEIAERDR